MFFSKLLGAFTCCMWVSSTGYYGNSDSFVFNMVDGYWKTYHSSGNNRYYQFSDESHLSVGEGYVCTIRSLSAPVLGEILKIFSLQRFKVNF